VIPLAEELAKCPRRKCHFFECGKRYSRRVWRAGQAH
jgi:hypothetical protein